MLRTSGKVDLRVKFGQFYYKGPFYVLDCAVPLILGMEFFAKVRPHIEWASRQVFMRLRDQWVSAKCVDIGKKVLDTVS